jgi:hypothetical protein
VLLGATLACRPSTAASPASISFGRDPGLRRYIDSLTDAPEFSNAHWGILIVDPSSGDTLYSRNAGKLFMPASNMKILTSSTALTQLGPDYRYRTSFLARGTIADGTLTGDLSSSAEATVRRRPHDARRDAPLRAIAIRSLREASRHHRPRHPVRRRVSRRGARLRLTYDDFEDSYRRRSTSPLQ